jgi:hypothetical protein
MAIPINRQSLRQPVRKELANLVKELHAQTVPNEGGMIRWMNTPGGPPRYASIFEDRSWPEVGGSILLEEVACGKP